MSQPETPFFTKGPMLELIRLGVPPLILRRRAYGLAWSSSTRSYGHVLLKCSP